MCFSEKILINVADLTKIFLAQVANVSHKKKIMYHFSKKA